MRLLPAAVLAVLASSPLLAAPPPGAAPGLAAIRPAALRAHVGFLADDLLEGRGTGTRGYDLAARYVATQLEALGVRPAGDGGSWLQPVRLREARVTGATLVLRRAGQPEHSLAPGVD